MDIEILKGELELLADTTVIELMDHGMSTAEAESLIKKFRDVIRLAFDAGMKGGSELEREYCAQICDKEAALEPPINHTNSAKNALMQVARRIRARGK